MTDAGRSATLTASQVFFMQLGFLLYESGFVEPVWRISVVVKNFEDCVVGILLHVLIGFSVSETTSIAGVIGPPHTVLAKGLPLDDYSTVLISSTFAVAAATIMSGSILERMKNKAYVAWVILLLGVNYTVIAHWVWNENGWLRKLGFIDNGGSLVIHLTGGVGGTVASWYLGTRHVIHKMNFTRSAIVKHNQLSEMKDPLYASMGVLVMWYGWFSFNIAPRDAKHTTAKYDDGVVGLVTLLTPCTSALMSFVNFRVFKRSRVQVDTILSCIIAGLVAITAGSATVDFWSSVIIGAFVPFIVTSTSRLTQYAQIDDPLDVAAVHITPGIYAALVEGIFNRDKGLITGQYTHFGVQLIGILVITATNVFLCMFMFEFIMKRLLFRNKTMRVTILNEYLGTKLYLLAPSQALEEVISAETDLARQILWYFRVYLVRHVSDEALDFILAVRYLADQIDEVDFHSQFEKVVQTYIGEGAPRQVNIRHFSCQTLRGRVDEIREAKMSLEILSPDGEFELKPRRTEHVEIRTNEDDMMLFDTAIDDILKTIDPVFAQFMKRFNLKKKTVNRVVPSPFKVRGNYKIRWTKGYDVKEIFDGAVEDEARDSLDHSGLNIMLDAMYSNTITPRTNSIQDVQNLAQTLTPHVEEHFAIKIDG